MRSLLDFFLDIPGNGVATIALFAGLIGKILWDWFTIKSSRSGHPYRSSNKLFEERMQEMHERHVDIDQYRGLETTVHTNHREIIGKLAETNKILAVLTERNMKGSVWGANITGKQALNTTDK